MTINNKKDGLIVLFVAVTTIVLIFGTTYYFLVDPMIPDEYLTIEGKIVNTETVLKDKGYIDHLILTFDTGKIIKVKRSFTTNDLTVNSRLILELGKEYEEDVWDIISIIKVPDNR